MRYYVQNLNGIGNNDVSSGYTPWLDFWENRANNKTDAFYVDGHQVPVNPIDKILL